MVVTSSHVCVSSSYGGEYPGEGYMARELFFVSARTNKRHHHQLMLLMRKPHPVQNLKPNS